MTATDSLSIWDSIPTVPCTNQLVSEAETAQRTSIETDGKESGVRRVHSASDVTMSLESEC